MTGASRSVSSSASISFHPVFKRSTFGTCPDEVSVPVRAVLVVVAVLVFVLGTAVYLFDRPRGYLHLLPSTWGGISTAAPVFGAWGGVIPSFAHAFAFTLLTALLLPRAPAAIVVACTGWTAVGAAFELCQHPAVAGPLVAALRGPLAGVPGADALAAYFWRGTFDPFDLVATVTGALGAAIVFGLAHLGATRARPTAASASPSEGTAPAAFDIATTTVSDGNPFGIVSLQSREHPASSEVVFVQARAPAPRPEGCRSETASSGPMQTPWRSSLPCP